MGTLNPACARLRDNALQLYPRMVAPGNISRIGSFRANERSDGSLELEFRGFALEPEASYELRDGSDGYGCEDPRVTFVPAIDRYVMAYVAFGPRGPEVAVAISEDGLLWTRLGLLQFQGSDEPFADKDAAIFPEPVLSPSGVESLAFYHRPTLQLAGNAKETLLAIEALPPSRREGISIAYAPLAAIRADINSLCVATETHRLELPPANWGTIKVGAGAPPVRIDEGWLSGNSWCRRAFASGRRRVVTVLCRRPHPRRATARPHPLSVAAPALRSEIRRRTSRRGWPRGFS